MEILLDIYVNREIECIHKSIELWNDKELLSLKNKLLPLVCEQGHIDFYKPMLEEAEEHYDDAIQSKKGRIFTEKEYGMYDTLLRVLDNNKEDIRQRMEERNPWMKKSLNGEPNGVYYWKTILNHINVLMYRIRLL